MSELGEGVRTRSAHARTQCGFALPEVLATLILMVVGLTAVMTAMLAIFTSSKANKEIVFSGIQATGVVESIQRAPYQACPASSPYNSSLSSTAMLTLTIAKIEYLTSNVSDTAAFQASCPPTGDKGVQRITVEARPSDGSSGVERVVILKRNDACPGTTLPGQTC